MTETTLLTIPVDIGELISTYLSSKDIAKLQRTCKRTKRYTDKRLLYLYNNSVPTREEIIKWIISCTETQNKFDTNLIWLVPSNQAYQLISIKVWFGRIVEFEFCSEERKEYDINIKKWLLEKIPANGIPSPTCQANVLLARGLEFYKAQDVATKYHDDIVFPVLSRYFYDIRNINTLRKNISYACCGSWPPFDKTLVEITDSLLAEYKTTYSKYKVFENTYKELLDIIQWSHSYKPQYYHRSLPKLLIEWGMVPSFFLVEYDNTLSRHSLVLLWLEERIRRKESARIKFITVDNVVVDIRIRGVSVIYRAYILRTVPFNVGYHIYHTSVPEDCLLENILKNRYIPGLIDEVTFQTVAEWKNGKLNSKILKEYVSNISDITKCRSVGYTIPEYLRLVMIVFFLFNSVSDERRNILLKNTFGSNFEFVETELSNYLSQLTPKQDHIHYQCICERPNKSKY